MARRRIGGWFRLAVVVLKPPLTVLTRRSWHGAEQLQRPGGIIVVPNHISYADPMVLAHFIYDAGRLPRFLAKDSLFRLPLAGRIVRGCGQIPVRRHSETAVEALREAREALHRGECVVIYPEGTVTKDPDYWPMKGRTGIARLVLDTGAPVVPIAQWGAQRILGRDQRPHLFPRHLVQVRAGSPVDLSRWAGAEPTAPVLAEVTTAVLGEVRRMLGEMRGETPPTEFLDPRRAGAAVEPAGRAAASPDGSRPPPGPE